MSFLALAWAAQQQTGGLATKSVLLALANYADEHGSAYPATATIAAFGEMDAKTATAALDRLVAIGLIADTGKRAGRTKQVKVYALALDKAPQKSPPKTEGIQKRKASVSSAESPPKTVDDPVTDPVTPVISSEITPPTSEIEVSGEEAVPFILKVEHVFEAWNDMAARTGLPKAKTIDDERRRKARALIRRRSIDDITEAINAVERSPFCRGENSRAWRADVDFLFQSKSFNRLIEGSYDGKG